MKVIDRHLPATCVQMRAAREAVRFAKDRYSHAAVAVLMGEPDAVAQTTAALEALTNARADLRDLTMGTL